MNGHYLLLKEDILENNEQYRSVEVVDVIECLFDLMKNAGEDLRKYMSGPHEKTRRTNLLLGSRGIIKDAWNELGVNPFTQYGDKDSQACLLAQLHMKLYPQLYTTPNTWTKSGETLVKFENLKYDCTFLNAPKLYRPPGNFPIAWCFDWVIEVENNPDEFAMTMRTLLDINCNHRLAVFYWNLRSNQTREKALQSTTNAFSKAWDYFKVTTGDASQIIDYSLHALIFPGGFSDKFSSISDYLANTMLIRWDQLDNAFIYV